MLKILVGAYWALYMIIFKCFTFMPSSFSYQTDGYWTNTSIVFLSSLQVFNLFVLFPKMEGQLRMVLFVVCMALHALILRRKSYYKFIIKTYHSRVSFYSEVLAGLYIFLTVISVFLFMGGFI